MSLTVSIFKLGEASVSTSLIICLAHTLNFVKPNNETSKGGYFDFELAPGMTGNVIYKQNHITVWKHSKVDRFFFRPIAELRTSSAKCHFNLITNVYEMQFEVTLSNDDVRKSCFRLS